MSTKKCRPLVRSVRKNRQLWDNQWHSSPIVAGMRVSLKCAGLAALVGFGPKSHDTSSMGRGWMSVTRIAMIDWTRSGTVAGLVENTGS